MSRPSGSEPQGRSRVVLKVGGRVAAQAASDAVALAAGGAEVTIVHGAGPQISAEMMRLGIEPVFVRGRRVTTPEVLAVVRTSFRAVNAAVCTAIGPAALGLMGDEIGLRARLVPELGLVGEALPSAPQALLDGLAAGRIPVVAPLAAGPLNVNADEAAAALAVGIGAERILFVTDVPGVYLDGGLLEAIDADDADRLLGAGAFDGGIVPKLAAAVHAARQGVRAEIGATEVLA